MRVNLPPLCNLQCSVGRRNVTHPPLLWLYGWLQAIKNEQLAELLDAKILQTNDLQVKFFQALDLGVD
jgi:hypothetical protein